jgi:transcriptional regulator
MAPIARDRDTTRGTLDMLILKALDLEPMHGWGIGARLEALSRGVFALQTGTLYPALHRLLRRGWVAADWRVTGHGRRARYYRLTPAGRRHLEQERQAWRRVALAVNRVVDAES